MLSSMSDCEEAQGLPCAVLEVRVYWDFELLQIHILGFKMFDGKLNIYKSSE